MQKGECDQFAILKLLHFCSFLFLHFRPSMLGTSCVFWG